MSRFYAHRVIEAAETVSALPIGNREKIGTESQARELSRVEPEQRAAVVEKAIQATGGKITAAAIRERKPQRSLSGLYAANSNRSARNCSRTNSRAPGVEAEAWISFPACSNRTTHPLGLTPSR